MCLAQLCIALDVKKPTLRLAFFSPAEKLLLLGGSSGSNADLLGNEIDPGVFALSATGTGQELRRASALPSCRRR